MKNPTGFTVIGLGAFMAAALSATALTPVTARAADTVLSGTVKSSAGEAMGGVTYSGGCIVSKLDGGSADGGYTLRLSAGTHHLDGEQALALARTRENLCAPNESDIQREEHQQALFTDMKTQLLSPSSFLRLPWIAWHAPPAIISDMSGVELLGMFAALAATGTPPTHVLLPTGQIVLPSGEEGLTISEEARKADVARFMSG